MYLGDRFLWCAMALFVSETTAMNSGKVDYFLKKDVVPWSCFYA